MTYRGTFCCEVPRPTRRAETAGCLAVGGVEPTVSGARVGPVKYLLLWLVAGLALTGCVPSRTAAPTPTPTPAHRWNVEEVQQLFLDWACPSLNLFAVQVFNPHAIPGADGDSWTILTIGGNYTFRESTRVFVPPTNESARAVAIRSTPECHGGSLPR